MLHKLAQLMAGLGLICLLTAGLLLAIGRSPESLVLNYQAEALGNFAYALLAISLLLRLFPDAKRD